MIKNENNKNQNLLVVRGVLDNVLTPSLERWRSWPAPASRAPWAHCAEPHHFGEHHNYPSGAASLPSSGIFFQGSWPHLGQGTGRPRHLSH
jgi:hypothetical protein